MTSPSRELGREVERLTSRLRDGTLQTLEFIAEGGQLGDEADVEELMRRAAREATELRRYLETFLEGEQPEILACVTRAIAQEQCLARHEISFAVGPTDGSVSGFRCVELAAAVREVLIHVRLEGHPTHVTVYLEESNEEVLLTLKSDGDLGREIGSKFPLGVLRSLSDRMDRLGGSIELKSLEKGGVLATLRLPPAADAARLPDTSVGDSPAA